MSNIPKINVGGSYLKKMGGKKSLRRNKKRQNKSRRYKKKRGGACGACGIGGSLGKI